MKHAGPLFALLTVLSTFAGGWLGLRIKHRLSGAMALTGGIVLGVALLDVLPEASDRIHDAKLLGLLIAAGLLWFFVLSRLLVLHHRDDPVEAARHQQVGVLGAAALSFHSLQDGFGIGAAFTLSTKLGIVVLLAVVAHDFADGMNTVTFVLSQHNHEGRARRWLVVDALAPLVGALAGSFLTVSSRAFGYGLAIYAGIFIMIGAGELLPEAHEETSMLRIALTIGGVALMFGVSRGAAV